MIFSLVRGNFLLHSLFLSLLPISLFRPFSYWGKNSLFSSFWYSMSDVLDSLATTHLDCIANVTKVPYLPVQFQPLNRFIPWIVSTAKIQFIRSKIEFCSNYVNFLQFPNSKENSFLVNYSRKYGTLYFT